MAQQPPRQNAPRNGGGGGASSGGGRADKGQHETFFLGRYRVRRGSMIALTNLATDEAIEATHRRYPGLPWPETA